MRSEAVTQMLGELLGIMAQQIPVLDETDVAQASYARGRNAEKEAVNFHLRFHMQRLGLRLPEEPAPIPQEIPHTPMDWDAWDAAHGR